MDEILKGKTVLVVDDTAVARVLAADILGASGIRILEAETGERALKHAAESPVDAFLLDIKLQDINGIELCRSLRTMAQYRNAPIIFVTALDQREVLQWAIEAGADDFIQKPLHAMVLRRRLANLLEKTAYVRQAESMSLSLRRYVSPRTGEIARIYATYGKLPAPRRQEACILFSDARGFTEMSQNLEPEALFEMLSGDLAAQVEIVNRHDGYVDKFSGDGVMAVFEGGDMAAKCCRCALDILDHTREYAAQKGLAGTRLAIGIHMGPAVIGNLGSEDYLDYTLVGTTVNLAARLCGIANQSIVVSRAVHDAVAGAGEFSFGPEQPSNIRGFRDPVIVHEMQRRPPAA
ncbi:MAG TPA: adenylate/guanylate cyclase domain-containing protein [Burkholderiales bacterium]|nr:adenylate/guanylate cyclase domain-containing protein [Burkholderiales bacterium]